MSATRNSPKPTTPSHITPLAIPTAPIKNPTASNAIITAINTVVPSHGQATYSHGNQECDLGYNMTRPWGLRQPYLAPDERRLAGAVVKERAHPGRAILGPGERGKHLCLELQPMVEVDVEPIVNCRLGRCQRPRRSCDELLGPAAGHAVNIPGRDQLVDHPNPQRLVRPD